jgi:type I restriction enzyme S subunit
MAGEWRETSLGEVTDFLSGGTPSKDRPDYWAGSVPWVSAKDMKRFRLDDTEDHVSDEGIANGTKLVPAGSVLLLARGMTLLNDLPICVISRPMTFNQDVKALRPQPDVRSDYLPYLLLGNKDRLLSLVDLAGHGTGRLNSDELKALDITLPPLPEQRAIAHILGTLDDKIELNRRMSETLEAMARALFKSWFVDFDPVRWKMERKGAKAQSRNENKTSLASSRPGDFALPPPLADLFPDSFEDSELGEIPRGWRVDRLHEVTGFLGGYAFKSKDWIKQGIPVVKIGSVKPGIVDLSAVSHVSNEVAVEAKRFRLAPGDLLIGMTGYVGEVGLVPPTDNPPLLNQRVGKFVLEKPGTAALAYLYCLTRQPDFKGEVETKSHGTAQANVSAEGILSIQIVMSPKALRDQFNRIAQPLIDRLLANHAESGNLAALRDALLPKLISGELRVKDAEKIIEREDAMAQGRKGTIP